MRMIAKMEQSIPANLQEKITQFQAIKISLELATDLFRTDMVHFAEELPKHLAVIRQWRMTMEREKEMSLKALRELRQFFLEAEHEKEMQRLSEFVRLCERMAIIAKDGTLEKVADVMLKLA